MFEYNNIPSATNGATYAYQHGATYREMMIAAIDEWYYAYENAYEENTFEYNPEDDEIVDALYERHSNLCYEVDRRF